MTIGRGGSRYSCRRIERGNARCPHFSLAIISVTLDIGVLGYISIVLHKEHFPEVFHIPPGTPCIYKKMSSKGLGDFELHL